MSETIKDILKKKETKQSVYLYIGVSICLNLLIETLCRKSVFASFKYMFTKPLVFTINTLILLMTLSFTMLLKKRYFFMSIVSILWILLALTDCIVRMNRTTPFTAVDLHMIDDALDIIDKYINFFTIMLAIVLAVVILIGLVIWFLKAPKLSYSIRYLYNLVILGIITFITILSINIGIETKLLSTKFPNLTIAFDEYGFPYCFGTSLFSMGVKKPSNYSKEKMDDIRKNLEESSDQKESPKVEKTPNIIFLQLESFFDINKVKGLKLSQDPIPNFNRLKAEYPSGFLNVHNVGYGTANTEFEIITGMNLDDFGPGEFPFKTILSETTCESVAYNLKRYGYATHAMHNNTGTFYSRNEIFSHLGFETYTSLEYMHATEFTSIGWAKDKVLTDEIIKVLNSTKEQDYLYVISVQGHGSYPADEPMENPKIKVEDMQGEGQRSHAVEYYVNQISEMDDFLFELIQALEQVDEETILVMYGDHLPSLGFSGKDLENASEYQTEYIIWNNMDIAMEDEDIETFQLSSKILEYLHMDEGIINRYHQTQKDSEEYLNGLQYLEYDILYGNKDIYQGENPYVPTEMQMGTYPISISMVEKGEEEEILIRGENFTEYSKVFVNGELYETEYVDDHTLKIQYADISPLDDFVVSQMWKSIVVSSSEHCLYYATQESGKEADLEEKQE